MVDQSSKSPSVWYVVRWICFAFVAFALLGLMSFGGGLAQAGTAAEKLPEGVEPQVASPSAPGSVYLPKVFHAFPCRRVSEVRLTGPSQGTNGISQGFVAEVTPVDASLPVTYTWRATDQVPVVRMAGLHDAVSFVWDLNGTKTVTVEAVNACGGVVSALLPVAVSFRDMIAFERNIDPGEGIHDIFIMYKDGTRLENVTNRADADDGAPTWSPDGNYLAFSSDRAGNGRRAIYLLDLQTGAVTPLTDGTYNDRWPAWSPAGDKIAFMREYDYFPDIFVMNVDGTSQQRLTDYPYGGSEFPAWSPDGQWIAFSSARYFAGRDLYLIRPDGTDLRVVLRTDRPEIDNDRRDEIYPSWAPDGRIYFTYRYRDYPDPKTEHLYRIWPDGSNMEKVFPDDHDRYIASWAPDGQCFVFYSRMGGIAGDDKEVWRWCYGLSAPMNLTNNSSGDEFCAWSPVP
jgi:Tol biopolymer transport system component